MGRIVFSDDEILQFVKKASLNKKRPKWSKLFSSDLSEYNDTDERNIREHLHSEFLIGFEPQKTMYQSNAQKLLNTSNELYEYFIGFINFPENEWVDAEILQLAIEHRDSRNKEKKERNSLEDTSEIRLEIERFKIGLEELFSEQKINFKLLEYEIEKLTEDFSETQFLRDKLQILIETELRVLGFIKYYQEISSEFIEMNEESFLSLLDRKKELIKETMNPPEKGSFLDSNAFARKRYHEHLEDLVNFETITNKIFGL
jgi:hypothetical protein